MIFTLNVKLAKPSRIYLDLYTDVHRDSEMLECILDFNVRKKWND